MSNSVDAAVAQKLVEYIDNVGMVAGNAAEYGWTLILRIDTSLNLCYNTVRR